MAAIQLNVMPVLTRVHTMLEINILWYVSWNNKRRLVLLFCLV